MLKKYIRNRIYKDTIEYSVITIIFSEYNRVKPHVDKRNTRYPTVYI